MEPKIVDRLPGFQAAWSGFLNNNANLRNHIDEQRLPDGSVRRLLSVVSLQRLPRMMRYLLDEDEFLSPYGLRALSRYHRKHPYRLPIDGYEQGVDYEPAESTTGLSAAIPTGAGRSGFPSISC